MSKRILFLVLFLWLASTIFPAFARQKTDTTYAFRSVPQKEISLRANLLRWATLTPDLGVEWRFNPSWSISVNGSWTSWSWNDKDRRYALWEVMPELRYYRERKTRLPWCHFQDRTVQLQALRDRQAGRPDWRRTNRRLYA